MNDATDTRTHAGFAFCRTGHHRATGSAFGAVDRPQDPGFRLQPWSRLFLINELFRQALGMRAGCGVVATVAQQQDYMERVRGNGGARAALHQGEGIVVLGQFKSHVEIALKLGLDPPTNGESIAVKLAPAAPDGAWATEIGGKCHRIAREGDPAIPAPQLPVV